MPVPVIDVRDGHDFIPAAIERGASAYLSSRPVPGPNVDVAAIEVVDTGEAPIALGRHARQRIGAVPGFAAVVGITGSVVDWFQNFNINTAGFIIVGMFVATWVISLAIWRFARIEERWSAGMERATAKSAQHADA